jgi:hypothetical protein
MLTKDLLRFRRINGYARPMFVDTSHKGLLDLATRLINIYDFEQGLSRAEIEEAALPLLKTQKDLKLAKGLNKIILDRCVFDIPGNTDCAGTRKKIFTRSAKLIKSGKFPGYMDFYNAMHPEDREILKFMEGGIYSDLPENEKLIGIKKIFPKELLQRYNCSLVQSLLIYSGNINIKVEDPDPAELRKMLKYLKFFALLAEFKSNAPPGPDIPQQLQLKVDGPMSLFENTRKYGIRLASFFPAVCGLRKWKIRTNLEINGSELKLSLDETSGLVSHYRNFSAYVPEEISVFKKLFSKKSGKWRFSESSPLLNMGGQNILFPDFTFENIETGNSTHLELFHRWHSGPLEKVIRHCERNTETPLIIGVDRFIYNKPETKKMLDSSDFFRQYGFLFRDFPAVSNVVKTLEAKEAPCPTSEDSLELEF